MNDIIERLEKAEWPYIELERDLALALGWKHVRTDGHDEPFAWQAPDGTHHDEYPDWLTSIDAAMTLVPEGRKVTLEHEPNCGFAMAGYAQARVYEPNKRDGFSVAEASTLALALCIAALKARASMDRSDRRWETGAL
jgi:hypothetical protein